MPARPSILVSSSVARRQSPCSRRRFLRLAALGAAAGAAACAQAPLPTPTLIPQPTPVPTVPPTALPPTPTEAALDPALINQIDDLLQKRLLATNKVPGVAMTVVKDGRPVYSKCLGVTEVGTQAAVTPETVFSWGYVAMPVTATAVMQLWDAGQVDLDAPVAEYLPYFRMADEDHRLITPRQLMTHTSGLAEYKGQESDWDGDAGDGALEQQVRSLAQDKLAYPNDGFFHLSLIGYEVLGAMVAEVAGQTFEAYLQDHVFAPLDLRHTTSLLSEVDPARQTQWHERAGSGDLTARPMYYSRQHAPAACLYASVEDMARLALMYLNQGTLGEAQVLSAAACEQMWKAKTFAPLTSGGVKWNTCSGWLCGDNPQGHRVVLMDCPYYSMLVLAPDGGVGLALAMNFSAMSSPWPDIAPIMEGLLAEA